MLFWWFDWTLVDLVRLIFLCFFLLFSVPAAFFLSRLAWILYDATILMPPHAHGFLVLSLLHLSSSFYTSLMIHVRFRFLDFILSFLTVARLPGFDWNAL